MKSEIRWVAPTYPALHHVLTNPVYAGAYAYGKSRIDQAVVEAFLRAVTPAAGKATRLAIQAPTSWAVLTQIR